jgi:RNA recognition motif-containing protein
MFGRTPGSLNIQGIHKETPTRTLFVRNLNPTENGNLQNLLRLFENFGPLRSSFCPASNASESSSYMMVSFFDIRHSVQAYENLQGYVLNGRKISIHYSIPYV